MGHGDIQRRLTLILFLLVAGCTGSSEFYPLEVRDHGEDSSPGSPVAEPVETPLGNENGAEEIPILTDEGQFSGTGFTTVQGGVYRGYIGLTSASSTPMEGTKYRMMAVESSLAGNFMNRGEGTP